MNTELGKRMIARSDADGLPEDHELRILAIKFEEAAAGYWKAPEDQTFTVKQFMGHYARARTAWCKYSGDSLV